MVKFGRIYELTVRGQKLGDHVIKFPLTCKFGIDRQQFSGINSAHFSIYGLSESSRKDIYYDSVFKVKPVPPIKFLAGYASSPSLTRVFSGTVSEAYTMREGPELITRINAMSGAPQISEAIVRQTIPAPWNFTSTMKYLMGKLGDIKVGEVLVGTRANPSKEPPPGTSPIVLNGKVWDVLMKYANGVDANLFIDNGVVHMLGQGIGIPSPASLSEISTDTGLLGIPKKNGDTVVCDMLFEPNFTIRQKLKLNSLLANWVNGDYVVSGINHTGTISGVESGDAVTKLTLQSDKAST